MSIVSVVIGRFQTNYPHKGYEGIFKRIENIGCDRIIVLLGVPFIGLSKKNPLDFQQREHMMRCFLEDTCESPFIILPISDNISHSDWSKNVDKLISSSTNYTDNITIYYGRDSFAPYYSGRYKTYELETVGKYSSTSDREVIKDEQKLSEDFRAGIIYATQNIFPHARSVVDVVVHKKADNKSYILMGRKENENDVWRVVGGFADPTDQNLEETVARELKEETSLSLRMKPKYLGSFKINDYRFRDISEYSLMSSLFLVENPEGEAVAGDDLVEVKWFEKDEVLSYTREEHKKLVSKALEYLYKNK